MIRRDRNQRFGVQLGQPVRFVAGVRVRFVHKVDNVAADVDFPLFKLHTIRFTFGRGGIAFHNTQQHRHNIRSGPKFHIAAQTGLLDGTLHIPQQFVHFRQL